MEIKILVSKEKSDFGYKVWSIEKKTTVGNLKTEDTAMT